MASHKKSRQPDLQSVTVSDARQDFAELVNRACFGRERFVLVRRGKRLAALVPVTDVEDVAA